MTEWKYPFSRSTDTHVDLTSLDAYNNGAPHATFERMRRYDPISWTEEKEGTGFWSITRHEDIRALNKDPETLSSARGIRMEDQSLEEYEARRTFQETDPPEHTEFRMLFNAAFSRISVGRFEEPIRKITSELFTKGLQMGELDATEQIARQLPMRILGQILGLPESDGDWLVEKGDALISNSDPDYTDFVVDKVDTDDYRFLPFRSPAALELFDYANDILKEIRKGKDYGVLNMITQPTKDGRVITDGEFRNFFCLAVAAGNDTTRYSIAASLQALANQPALMDYLRNPDKGKILKATDEMVRWASPTTHFRRTATKDFEYGGKQISEGDKIILWFASGNRDHDAFEDPYEVKLDRTPNRHIGFGQGGPHVCLGMFLAKMEVGMVLEEVANNVETMEQTAQHEFLRSNFILGIKKLPLRMTPRR